MAFYPFQKRNAWLSCYNPNKTKGNTAALARIKGRRDLPTQHIMAQKYLTQYEER
jgi:hypothetical protein